MPRGGKPIPVPRDIANRILEGLHSGRALTAILEEDGMPSVIAVTRWKQKDADFAAAYAAARREGAALAFDEAGKIVDEATPEDFQVAKLRAEHRYKMAACYCPKIFGAKAQLEHSGRLSLDAIIGQTIAQPDAAAPEPESIGEGTE